MVNKKDISKNLMKSVGIIVDKKGNELVFKIPANIWNVAEKEFNFSFDMLEVGGDLSPHELAEHLDMQSSNEARFGSLSEIVRYQKEVVEMKFELWYNKKFWECKEKLANGRNTDKAVHAYIMKKWPKTYEKLKRPVMDLEFKYRLLSNAIYSSIVTKGKMLQSLRNIIQGNFDGATSIKAEKEKITNLKT